MVAGEIVRTSRMFAMSVSPLTRNILSRISSHDGKGTLEARLLELQGKSQRGKGSRDGSGREKDGLGRRRETEALSRKEKASGKGAKNSGKASGQDELPETLVLGGQVFEIERVKGKKSLILPLSQLKQALQALENAGEEGKLAQAGGLKAKVKIFFQIDGTKVIYMRL